MRKEISIGQKVMAYRCGAGHTIFGEIATLNRATKQHLVFVTESGAQIKTKRVNIHIVIGLAKENGYNISLHTETTGKEFIPEKVRFWDKKTHAFVTK